MHFYILKTSAYTKIGISYDTHHRINQISAQDSILDSHLIEIKGYPVEVVNFIEASTILHFKSATEYISTANFADIVDYVNQLFANILYHYYFLNPLHSNICCINNLYYDLKPAVNYINNLRIMDNKNRWNVADYFKTKNAKQLNNVICKEKKIDVAFITKIGSYGSTYATPEMVFDFICSAHVIAKYDILNWAIHNNTEFKRFLNPTL
jgi:hypothetical protein